MGGNPENDCPTWKMADLLLAAVAGNIRLAHGLLVRGSFTPVDGIEYFAPVDRHFLWGLDPKADLVPSDLHNHDRNVIVDDNTLVLLSG
jgi:hypothetical protein